MIITKVRLKNWKNFGEVDVACGKRVFIIGPNAAGKSNFLDALRFLRDVARDGISRAVSARGGIKAIRYVNARRPSDISISVTVDEAWEYALSFTIDNKNEPIVSGEKVFFIKSDGEKIKILDRPDARDRSDTALLTQTALQQVNTNKDFRGVADFFASIQYRHILPQLVRDPKNFSPETSKNDPYGRDIISQIWNTPQKNRDARLRKINDALKIAVPKFSNLSVELNQSTGAPHLKVKYEHWRVRGANQFESAFSDGTLRLLTLLWTLLESGGPLLLEEPELSLHEEIIQQLPTLFTKVDRTRKTEVRQIFITTHARAMLDDSGVRHDEVLRLEPGGEGTEICAADEREISMMEEGASAADVLLPKTRPANIQRLSHLAL